MVTCSRIDPYFILLQQMSYVDKANIREENRKSITRHLYII